VLLVEEDSTTQTNSNLTPSNQVHEVGVTANPKSNDLDSLGMVHPDGKVEATRQAYSGFVETTSGNPLADKDTAWRKAIYDNEPVTGVERMGKGIFGRTVVQQEVGGIDKPIIDFLAADYNLWANYGTPDQGTTDYERFKWFDNDLMENNDEAAELLASDVDPRTIISDKDYRWVSYNVELLREAHATQDYSDRAGLQNAAKLLSSNLDKVVGYKKRMWLDDMSSDQFTASIVLERLEDSASAVRSKEERNNRSIDVTADKPRGFWENVKLGWDTNWLQSRRGRKLFKDSDTEMMVWMQENSDTMDAQFIKSAWESYQRGSTVESAIDLATNEETTYKYQAGSKGSTIIESVGLGVGEFGGNPVNWLLASPIYSSATAVASKVPSILQPLTKGALIGTGESLVNDFTAGHTLTAEEKTERAAWNAVAGGGILTTLQMGKWGLDSYVKHLSDKAKTPQLVDDVSESVTQVTENNSQALIRQKAEAGRRQRAQDQVKINRASEDAYQAATDEVEGLTVTQSKALLRDVYNEMGLKGHSKFTTKQAIRDNLAQMRARQAADNAKSKLEVERVAKERRDADLATKREADAKAQAAQEQQAADAKVKAEEAEVNAQDALDLAVINKRRIEGDKKPYESVDDAGFSDDLASLKQERAIEDAGKDLEDITTARKSLNAFARGYNALTKGLGLESMTTKGLNIEDGVVKYAAAKLLETGAGYAGRASRPATAALIKDTIHKRSYSNIMGAYQRSMNSWATDKGLNYLQNINARNVGEANKYADEFHKEVYLAQERLAMGDTVDIAPAIQDYLKVWDNEMGSLFKEARDAGVTGFGKNVRKHYQPRVWKKGKVANIARIYGEDSVRKLLKESMESAARKGKVFDGELGTIDEMVDRQLNWINGLGDSMTSYKVGVNARTKARMPLDMTVEIPTSGGKKLRMVDLVDTNIPSMSATYTQRTSGSVGLARATDGAIRDEREFALFAERASTDEAKQFMKDTSDMLFGYPTREGMNPMMRTMMDSAQYAQLETLGVAQLATVGTSLQAVVANWVSQPEVAKSILKMAGGGDEHLVMRQIRERSAVNNNIRYSNRADVHTLDQAQIDEISDFSIAMNDTVDKLTGGDAKSLLSRGLGKLSGYDAIAQYQSKLTQASFTTETARQVVLNSSSFTNERLADLGVLSLKDGKFVDTKLSKAYKEHVEFTSSGELKDMHFEKWTDDQMREYTYSMNRYEAQVMPYIMAGELPQFMNMPEMQFALHYLKTPLAFGTKGTGRQLGFADKEAAVAVAMNTLSAGLVRYAYVTGIGATHSALVGAEIDGSPDASAMKVHNYLDWLGWMGEGYNKTSAVYKAISDGSVDPLGSELPPAIKQVQNMATLSPDALPALVPGLPVVLDGIIERMGQYMQTTKMDELKPSLTIKKDHGDK